VSESAAVSWCEKLAGAGREAGSGSYRNRFERQAEILLLPLRSHALYLSWWPRTEPVAIKSQVQCPNHWTTEPHSDTIESKVMAEQCDDICISSYNSSPPPFWPMSTVATVSHPSQLLLSTCKHCLAFFYPKTQSEMLTNIWSVHLAISIPLCSSSRVYSTLWS